MQEDLQTLNKDLLSRNKQLMDALDVQFAKAQQDYITGYEILSLELKKEMNRLHPDSTPMDLNSHL